MSACAFAKPHMLTWEWPTTDCEGLTIVASDLVESELIYSSVPMPMPSDTDGPCAVTADPDAPAGSLSVPIPVTDNTVILNLHPGQTYYARMRVSAYVDGNWSSWSDQAQFTIPYGRPNKIIMSNGWNQLEYNLLDVSELEFGG